MDLTEIWSDTMTKPKYIWACGEVEPLLLDFNWTLFKKINIYIYIYIYFFFQGCLICDEGRLFHSLTMNLTVRNDLSAVNFTWNLVLINYLRQIYFCMMFYKTKCFQIRAYRAKVYSTVIYPCFKGVKNIPQGHTQSFSKRNTRLYKYISRGILKSNSMPDFERRKTLRQPESRISDLAITSDYDVSWYYSAMMQHRCRRACSHH